MKKIFISIMIPVFVALVFINTGNTEYSDTVIEKLKINVSEVPDGFMFGKVPDFAKRVLKENPWNMDRDAIKFLTGRIYPGGDSNVVKKIYMTIIADKNHPFGDDIVCYVILYNDAKTAKNEIVKVNEYVGYNSDRSIALTKDNMVVYFCVDDISHYHYIRELADMFQSKLECL